MVGIISAVLGLLFRDRINSMWVYKMGFRGGEDSFELRYSCDLYGGCVSIMGMDCRDPETFREGLRERIQRGVEPIFVKKIPQDLSPELRKKFYNLPKNFAFEFKPLSETDIGYLRE
ncbi:MAG: hypothetical protein ABIA78_03395 [archaeon]